MTSLRPQPSPISLQRNNAIARAVLALAILSALPVRLRAEFVKVSGIDAARVERVAVGQGDPSSLAVASDNTLYLGNVNTMEFRKALVLKDEQVTGMAWDGKPGSAVLLAGSRNGYRVAQTPDKIFTGRENETLYFIEQHGNTLFAGTSEGLYRADSSVMDWQKLAGLGNEMVRSMEMDGTDLYLVCGSGVYTCQPDGGPTRIFVARNEESDGDSLIPYRLHADPNQDPRLWLCTSKGIFHSDDKGQSWFKDYFGGVGNAAVFCMVDDPLDAGWHYLCTDAGLFRIEPKTGNTQNLYMGLPTSRINWLATTSTGDLFLASDQGLFRKTASHQGTPSTTPSPADGLANLMEGEPSIQEVQEAALKYNSANAGKTDAWKKRLKYRALLPKLSVDYDKTIGSSFTSSGYYYAEGPNDWGVSLTWDMGDLIWNTYEDDIDNRAKLTTQLRMDILDEINRLYFERLRLKHEIIAARARNEDTILTELRLQEITATLDGYTGGIFSR